MLELKNISKCFGSKIIFNDFNLSISQGDIISLVGSSGGGKTTLLRMLAGLESFDSGEMIYKENAVPLNYLENNQLLGLVFQDFQLFPHLSVLENLMLSPIKTKNIIKNEAENKALMLLEQLGLKNHANDYPFSLSGGQKQRVALARAMMIDPEIIGYDEPTSALDPGLRQEVEKLILFNKKNGMTQIVVTHDLSFAQVISDKIIKINTENEEK